jgi:hypothetical protein
VRGGLLGLWVVLGIGSLVLAIVAAVDASRHPNWVWQRAGKSKVLWIVLPLVLFFACGVVGGGVALFYLLSIKPSLVALEQQAPPGAGSPGGWGQPPPPPPTWGQPPPPPPTWGQPPPPPEPGGSPPPPPGS